MCTPRGPTFRQTAQGGLECGWPEKDKIEKYGYIREQITQTYPKISELWIYLDLLKSCLTLFSPQVQEKNRPRDTGSADHAGGVGGGSLRDDCDGYGAALYNPYRQ